MKNVEEVLNGVTSLAILGHVRPDGDCVGSCTALYMYVKKYYPDIDVDLYLEEARPVFDYIWGIKEKKGSPIPDKTYDLAITVDASSYDRIGVSGEIFSSAKKTVCIDHHVSNKGFADINHVLPDASSASEVLYELLDADKVDRDIAQAIYTGIIHDTGVFQYSNTSPKTMQIAGELMKTGFDFNEIIDKSFYEKTYVQNMVMGRVLAESIMLLDNKVIVGYIRSKVMRFYNVEPMDLDGIVNQLRLTAGVETAIFLYETGLMEYKVSMRSGKKVDVSKVAQMFGGGGHIRAAGCTMSGSVHDVINNLTKEIEEQLLEE